jgi:hypothetical protein
MSPHFKMPFAFAPNYTGINLSHAKPEYTSTAP